MNSSVFILFLASLVCTQAHKINEEMMIRKFNSVSHIESRSTDFLLPSSQTVQSLGDNRIKNAFTCGLKYVTQVFTLSKEIFETTLEGRKVVIQFMNAFNNCRNNSLGFIVCVSQSGRDIWEQNELLREKLLAQSLKVSQLFENIYRCLVNTES